MAFNIELDAESAKRWMEPPAADGVQRPVVLGLFIFTASSNQLSKLGVAKSEA